MSQDNLTWFSDIESPKILFLLELLHKVCCNTSWQIHLVFRHRISRNIFYQKNYSIKFFLRHLDRRTCFSDIGCAYWPLFGRVLLIDPWILTEISFTLVQVLLDFWQIMNQFIDSTSVVINLDITTPQTIDIFFNSIYFK